LADNLGAVSVVGENRAKQVGFFVAKTPFGEVGDEQLSIVHDERNAQFGFALAQDIPHNWIQKELANSVLLWSNRLAFETIANEFETTKSTDGRQH
jgi:hypothetical protein